MHPWTTYRRDDVDDDYLRGLAEAYELDLESQLGRDNSHLVAKYAHLPARATRPNLFRCENRELEAIRNNAERVRIAVLHQYPRLGRLSTGTKASYHKVDQRFMDICAQHAGLHRVALRTSTYDAYIDCEGANPCDHKKYMTCYSKDMLLTPQDSWQSCVKNEYWSLRDRHLMEMIPVNPLAFIWMMCFARQWLKKLPTCGPTPSDVWLATRSTKVKQKYRGMNATAAPRHVEYNQMFVKFEKMTGRDKPPRAIQAFRPEYNFMLTEHFFTIEHMLYQSRPAINGGHRLFAKQRNMRQRAEDLLGIYEDEIFDDPIFINIDHSRFDSRVGQSLMYLEFAIYAGCSSEPEDLLSLLEHQTAGVGFTKGGIRYSSTARRKSGVINTGLGNSVINYCIISFVFRGVRYLCYIDGDDAVVVIDRKDLLLVNLDDFGLCGMKTEIIIREGINDMRFCQSAIMQLADGPCMVRDPLRSLSRGAWSCAMCPPKGYTAMVGTCEARVNNGVPMVDTFFRKQSEPTKDIMWTLMGYNSARDMYSRPEEPIPITDDVRSQFAELFGIDAVTQQDFEARCKRWVSRCPCKCRTECLSQFTLDEEEVFFI